MFRRIGILACVALVSFLLVNQVDAQDTDIVPPIESIDLDPDEEALLAIFDQFHGEVLNTHDMEGILSFFAEDAVFDYVPSPPPLEGREAIGAFFESVFQAFPDWKCCPEGSRRKLISDNIVVVECTVVGTQEAEWSGIPATGKTIQTIHLDICEYEGDKIKRLTTYEDAVSFMVQLGLMPAPEPLELVPSAAPPDPEAPGLPPLEAAENIAAVWNTGDLDNYMKLIHSDAEVLIAPLGATLDRNAFMAAEELYFATYPDLQQEIVRMVDMEDGWVLAEVVFTGTNDGPYYGLPPTGNAATVRGVWLARFDADGLMTYMSVYLDELTTMAQLGLFPPPPDPKDIARRDFEEIWNQGNLDVVDEIVAPDIVIHVPPEPDTVGAEAYKGMVATYRVAFPDMQWIIEDITAQGDMVALRLTATGTHQGEFMGIPPTGVQITGTMIAIVRVVDGKQVEAWNYADFLGFMQQIGVITPGRPAPENYVWGTPSEVTGDPGSPEANEALITRLIDEFWNQGNLDIASEIFSDDLVSHNPPISAMYPSTADSLKQYATDVFAAFPDFQVVLDDLILEGDRAVGHWTATGTHEGEFLGIPATGRHASVPGVTIYRFADNKIVEMWWAWDAMGLMQKLTAPPPKYEVYALMISVFEDGGVIFRFADESRTDVYAKNREDAPINCIYVKGPGVELIYGPGPSQEAMEMLGMPYYGHEEMLSKIGVSLDQIDYVVIDHTCFDHPGGVDLFPNATVIVQKALFDQPNPLVFPMPDGSMFPLPLEQDYAKLEQIREEGRLLVVEGDYEIAPGLTTHHTPGHTYETNFLTIDTEDGTVVAAGDTCYTYLNLKYDIPPVEALMVDSEAMLQGYEKIRQAIDSDALLVPGHEMDVYKRYTQVADRVVKIELPKGDFTNVFFTQLDPGLNMISLPLKPMFQHDARSFAEMLGATMVVRYDSDIGDFVAFIPYAPDDGFPIEGGQGYIINVPKGAVIPFTGSVWTNNPPFEMAPPVQRISAWAFVVGGWVLDGEGMSASDGGYTVTVKNLRTGAVVAKTVGEDGYFAAAYADLSRKSVVEAGDKVEVAVIDSRGKVVSGPFVHDITLDGIRNAVVKVQLRLGHIIPEKSALLQNYPNPFNPETWIPFHLKNEASVSVRIFNLSGQLIKTLDLGHKDAGVYVSRTKAAYWDGKNEAGEEVSSGIYFYSIAAGDFSSTRKMIIRK